MPASHEASSFGTADALTAREMTLDTEQTGAFHREAMNHSHSIAANFMMAEGNMVWVREHRILWYTFFRATLRND